MSRDEDLQQRISETLDRQEVDGSTRDALRQSRKLALEASSDHRWSIRVPAFAIAAVVIAGIGVALLYPAIDEEQIPASAFDDLVVIDSEDELELFEELEFYVWLEQQEQG